MAKRKRRKRIRLIHVIILFLVIYVSAIMINQRKLMNDMKGKRAELEADIQNLEKEIKELSEEIEHSDSLEFVEKVAREEMGMVKPREIIYIDKKRFKDSIFNLFRK